MFNFLFGNTKDETRHAWAMESAQRKLSVTKSGLVDLIGVCITDRILSVLVDHINEIDENMKTLEITRYPLTDKTDLTLVNGKLEIVER